MVTSTSIFPLLGALSVASTLWTTTTAFPAGQSRSLFSEVNGTHIRAASTSSGSTSSSSSSYALTSSSDPVPLSADLRQLITTKTTKFNGAAYCSSPFKGQWKCGPLCDAVPDFQLTAWGGDGGVHQRYFVGWNPSSKEIIATRQGADFTHFATIPYALDFTYARLHPDIAQAFSRIPSLNTSTPSNSSTQNILIGALAALASIFSPSKGNTSTADLIAHARVNAGFQSAWAQSYPALRTAVEAQLAAHPDARGIFVSGHSLGAALSVLDGVALRGAVKGSVIPVQVSVTGQPRVGNAVFAGLVDALGRDGSQKFAYHRVSHHHDPFVHLFPTVVGYEHSMNEIWLPDTNSSATSNAFFCSGRENQRCAASVPTNSYSLLDHAGPYLGTIIAPLSSLAA
ncbi:hypothetical protein OC835_006457 [Tilletia horrida]|nr:hypothetical protein OC835_006457 [Tilletia horrida]